MSTRRPARDRLLDAVAEERAVGQAGQRVVQRLVLLGDRRAAAAVHGEERQQQEQQRGQRELGGEHDDRREAEQQAGGRGLEEEVVGQVAPELDDALGERDDGRDERAVDHEEDGGDQQDERTGRSGRTAARRARGTSVSATSTSEAVATEIAYWAALKATFLSPLPLIVSATMLAADEAHERDGGAAGDHQREREAGRGRDLALRAAGVDLHRHQLAHERARREQRELRRQEPVESVEARPDDERRACRARSDHQGHVDVQWLGRRVMAGVTVGCDSNEREGALPRQPRVWRRSQAPSGSPLAAVPGVHGVLRSESTVVIAAAIRTTSSRRRLPRGRPPPRRQRTPRSVETLLHHFCDLLVSGSPFRSQATERIGDADLGLSIWTYVRVRPRTRARR